ncbi:MAG: CoA-binding protein [Bacteroidetes bacterium]|jgi:predicted CoA-binding protein|nr:CoA-binding protein [Bacteroidota bacterium]MCL5035302.1 CoA-binding protein [Bacteroidota bacterium]
MEQSIKDFVQLKRLAVVGVSRNKNKFGNTIHRELKKRGYEVFGVNPTLSEIGDDKCFRTLTELKDKVEGAIVCVTPDSVDQILREAAGTGIRYIWLQQGAEHPGVRELAGSLNLTLVTGKCILMYAEPVDSVHNIHRFLVKLFGKL